MTFKSYSKTASKTAIYPDYVKLLYPLLGLSGEVGEVMNKIKKHYRDDVPLDKGDLKKELGDILWYLNAVCKDLNIDFEDMAQSNLDKLLDRKKRGVIGGSGDER
mgnify:CR=1 FL=1